MTNQEIIKLAAALHASEGEAQVIEAVWPNDRADWQLLVVAMKVLANGKYWISLDNPETIERVRNLAIEGGWKTKSATLDMLDYPGCGSHMIGIVARIGGG